MTTKKSVLVAAILLAITAFFFTPNPASAQQYVPRGPSRSFGGHSYGSYGQASNIVDSVANLALGIVAETQETRRAEVAASHDDNMAGQGLNSVERISARGMTQSPQMRGPEVVAPSEMSASGWTRPNEAQQQTRHPYVKNSTPSFVTIKIFNKETGADMGVFKNLAPGTVVAFPDDIDLDKIMVVCSPHVPTHQGPAKAAAGTYETDNVITVPTYTGHECRPYVANQQPAK